ncbi:SEC-C metal-binding domain-containing protein [uncultured Paraglaciecola sp.]|uniref:SEC-C metal-binding domain-containing protein n=1 Tax=uncultured Paraglaciecola sp. TaxID=1765024 RepID=UPI0030D9A51F
MAAIESVTKETSCCSHSSCCAPQEPIVRDKPKVGRNDPCPCGNGRKFKKCCGKNR